MALAAMLVGCTTDNTSAPSALMDGSPADQPTIELQGIARPAVLTTVDVTQATEVRDGSPSADCLRARRVGPQPRRLVERVGVESSSVTFATASGMHACDDSPGARENGRRWCGTSFGVLTDGRLGDPRLDMAGCKARSGRQMGFAWVEPGPDASYVSVEQESYVEVYEPAGSLPVRVATTSGVEVDGSRASFRISEHDAGGRLLRSYVLEAVPAG